MGREHKHEDLVNAIYNVTFFATAAVAAVVGFVAGALVF